MLVQGGGQCAAILASGAREVCPRTAAIRLPGAAEFVCGVVNVRGTLVPLVDLGILLGAGPATPPGWVVLFDLDGRRFALAVDALPRLRTADAPPGAAPDAFAGPAHRVCVDGTTLPLLDVAALADDFLLQ
ncbi:MAG: chemotaxis protein CheW [Gemmatimonadaceae bacterium]|nr:chemotaxis protein CheW [Gemmatimonadaceae bacterium]